MTQIAILRKNIKKLFNHGIYARFSKMPGALSYLKERDMYLCFDGSKKPFSRSLYSRKRFEMIDRVISLVRR